MAFPQVEIKDYAERPNIFAIRLPSGRWHDFDRATLAAEWAWYYHLAKCDNHVTEALQVQIQNAVDELNELDGVIPFTEALGKGDATEYDTELAYLVREVGRLSIEGATYLWSHTVNPLVAATVLGTENSVESTEDGARWALVDAAYLDRLRDAATPASLLLGGEAAPLGDGELAELANLKPSSPLPWINNSRFIGRAPEGLLAKSFISELDAAYATAAANALPSLLARLAKAESAAAPGSVTSPVEPAAAIQRVLEKWVEVRPGELDDDAVPNFLDELRQAGLQLAPVLQPVEQAAPALATFVQQAYAYKSTFPGLPEGYTHEDIDKLYEWSNGADDLLRTAPQMQAAATPASPAIEGAAASGWVSVQERLPAEEEIVLIWARQRYDDVWGSEFANYRPNAIHGMAWETHKRGWLALCPLVTHWQPLPQAPTDGN